MVTTEKPRPKGRQKMVLLFLSGCFVLGAFFYLLSDFVLISSLFYPYSTPIPFRFVLCCVCS
jgi:hypothetical protein